jgi:AcrR family transcriptional regulator
MQAKAPDADDGRLREGGSRRVPETEARILRAALEVSGERGYAETTVQNVLNRYHGHRAQFYKYFANLAECFATAYATESERLSVELLAAGRGGASWRDGLEAALRELGRFAQEQTALARGLVNEVHAAGEPARGKRDEVLERLSRAIDSARRETGSRHSPPPLTAMFIVHVIDAALADSLARGAPERFTESVPEFVDLAATYYGLGD